MANYKISLKDQENDYEVLQNGMIRIFTTNCKRKNRLVVGKTVIPCDDVFDEWLVSDMIIRPGERIMLGKNSYIDYESDNRLYLDYEKYMKLMEAVKMFYKVRVFDYDCKFDEYGYLNMGNAYKFNEKMILIPEILGGQTVFVKGKEGYTTISTTGCKILKGECIACGLGDYPICYGDPE